MASHDFALVMAAVMSEDGLPISDSWITAVAVVSMLGASELLQLWLAAASALKSCRK